MKNFPNAKDLPCEEDSYGLVKPSLKAKIEVWIMTELRPLLLEYTLGDSPYVVAPAPDEYYEQREEFKKVFEALITPHGYKPVYTHDGGGVYDMVGVEWAGV